MISSYFYLLDVWEISIANIVVVREVPLIWEYSFSFIRIIRYHWPAFCQGFVSPWFRPWIMHLGSIRSSKGMRYGGPHSFFFLPQLAWSSSRIKPLYVLLISSVAILSFVDITYESGDASIRFQEIWRGKIAVIQLSSSNNLVWT